MINVEAKQVHCSVRNTIPEESETIADDFHLEEIISMTKHIEYYFRSPEECPYARGNWIIDIMLEDGNIFCIKMPKEMEKEKFENWIKPLIEMFKEKMH